MLVAVEVGSTGCEDGFRVTDHEFFIFFPAFYVVILVEPNTQTAFALEKASCCADLLELRSSFSLGGGQLSCSW